MIEDTQSPQHLIDIIKYRILWEENLSETLNSLNNLTLLELFWMYERILVRDMIIAAREKDEQMTKKITENH